MTATSSPERLPKSDNLHKLEELDILSKLRDEGFTRQIAWAQGGIQASSTTAALLYSRARVWKSRLRKCGGRCARE